jgi:hypothetical protein
MSLPSWLKSATYILSTISGIAATAFPAYSVYLIPLSTFLAGLATTHPSDVAQSTPDPDAVAKLAAKVQAQVAANKKVEVAK